MPPQSSFARTLLLTGFPGFIGARLIVRLLKDDPELRVVALVEPKMVERARAAAQKLSDRVTIEPGDITDPRLGLGEARYRELAANVTSVMHLAAVYDLAVPASVAQAVNVDGTRHILDFCRACTKLERHHYVSTAYVAGRRSGRVLESELDVGQSFKNHYESTKYAAEVLVKASLKDIPTTIYRPAVVVGDSRTGETQKFDGPYYLLRFVALFGRLHLPLPQIASEHATFNAVPVDFIVDAIAAGVREPKMVGETLHLVDPAPVAAAELLRLLVRSYSGKTLHYRVPSGIVANALALSPVRKLLAHTPRETVLYLNHPVTFDTSRATELLAPHGVSCPRIPDYADNLVSFFRAHEGDAELAPKR